MSYFQERVAVIIPAFNEEQSIARVVSELRALRSPQNQHLPLIDDLIVCNNGSTDNTSVLAKEAGASVFSEFRKGYGFACLCGIQKLSRPGQVPPDIVVFVDGDHSVDANDVENLLKQIYAGADLVIGNRVSDRQETHALSPHQQFGNDLASGLIRLLWRQPISDLGPFRAIRYKALMQLDMQDQRFGWTVEMQVKAIQAGLSYKEVPVKSLRRIGVSKISGTLSGTVGAAYGIFSTVFKLYVLQARFRESLKSRQHSPT